MKKQILTEAASKASHILSQAIVSDGLVFVSGQVHNDLTGSLVGETVEEKLVQIMKNIEAILSAGGAGLDDIVKATVYVTDMAQLPELNAHYPTYFAEPYPAREAVCVAALPLGATIEISVIASIGDNT